MAVWDAGADGVLTLPDGRRVRGTGVRRPRVAGLEPEFGLYLLARDPGPTDWPHQWVRWRDFRLPDSTADAGDALREAHARAASERVEVACGGGIGRTGTALAALAVLSGLDPREAVGWVRRHYHRRAVETPWQRRWVTRAAYRG